MAPTVPDCETTRFLGGVMTPTARTPVSSSTKESRGLATPNVRPQERSPRMESRRL